MPTLVKICGIHDAKALDAALESRADFVGFVFFPPSPRNVTTDEATALGARVGGQARKVALTVDADDALHENIIAALAPDILQLHGKETPQRVSDLRARFGLPVMKALAIETKDDRAAISAYAEAADWLLFDARPPRDATRPGGLGRPFDWTLLKALDPGRPFMLSGGLERNNVAEAMAITRAPAVDVSSGVESAPGIKDPARIADFIRAVRDNDAEPARMASTR
jgi:phosphoribosylanthranilate isomerase